MIYAINKATKEHRIAAENWAFAGDWVKVEADADGWIEWEGNDDAKLPLPIRSAHEVITKAGVVFPRSCPSNTNWGSNTTVVAYRPILEPQAEQVKEWSGPEDGLPPVGERVEIEASENDWLPGKVIMHHDGRALVYLDSASRWRYESADADKLRPIRTDRERWIEAATTLRIPGQDGIGNAAAQALYDAGLAKLPVTDHE
ncbi:hypothetical protein [Vreelandella populi]|uniref:Uncharacterized protein n=1 Tax=Vreelandella populi TaxID=2498858 RepID=A0A3S0YLE4_9GAMM|nr:hypothetical protein [Halomonas populi]RUR48841.1 hypothetical protein ELY37_03045 [Halomonas populi]